jgi:son of sevenless-like protein
MDFSKGQRELVAIQERDHAELREILQTIIKDVDDLRTIMNMKSPEVQGIMESIQEVGQVFKHKATFHIRVGTSRSKY